MKINVCPCCGSGDIRWCNISIRPYCGDCRQWGAVNFGNAQNAIDNWNHTSIRVHGEDIPCVDYKDGVVSFLRTEEPKMITLTEAVSYFFEPEAYDLMRKHGQNRVTCFNIAIREAFKREDTSEYAHALRAYANHLDETGILPETLEG